jgi:hypothetical protein
MKRDQRYRKRQEGQTSSPTNCSEEKEQTREENILRVTSVQKARHHAPIMVLIFVQTKSPHVMTEIIRSTEP